MSSCNEVDTYTNFFSSSFLMKIYFRGNRTWFTSPTLMYKLLTLLGDHQTVFSLIYFKAFQLFLFKFNMTTPYLLWNHLNNIIRLSVIYCWGQIGSFSPPVWWFPDDSALVCSHKAPTTDAITVEAHSDWRARVIRPPLKYFCPVPSDKTSQAVWRAESQSS